MIQTKLEATKVVWISNSCRLHYKSKGAISPMTEDTWGRSSVVASLYWLKNRWNINPVNIGDMILILQTNTCRQVSASGFWSVLRSKSSRPGYSDAAFMDPLPVPVLSARQLPPLARLWQRCASASPSKTIICSNGFSWDGADLRRGTDLFHSFLNQSGQLYCLN